MKAVERHAKIDFKQRVRAICFSHEVTTTFSRRLRRRVRFATNLSTGCGDRRKHILFHRQQMSEWAYCAEVHEGRRVRPLHARAKRSKCGSGIRGRKLTGAQAFGSNGRSGGNGYDLCFAEALPSRSFGSVYRLTELRRLRQDKCEISSRSATSTAPCEAIRNNSRRSHRYFRAAVAVLRNMRGAVQKPAKDARRPLPRNGRSAWTSLSDVQSGSWFISGRSAGYAEGGSLCR